MTIYDEIEVIVTEIPSGVSDIAEILVAISAGITLYPLLSADTLDAQRTFLLRIAALTVQGIRYTDELIEVEVELDNEDPF